jgi:hypothetical protein
MKQELAWLCNELGIKPTSLAKKSNFEDRLRLQKTSYFLKCLGIPSFQGFNFNLYLRGPYSPSLSAEYYDLEGVNPQPIDLSSKRDLLDWFMKKSSKDMEVTTSILLVSRIRTQNDQKLTDDDIHSILTVSKPWITKPLFGKSVGELREKGLIE